MLSIFGRYVFRQAAGALALILFSLTGVVWIALALRQLNLVTSKGQDAVVFLKMTTLALPNLMALIAPIALLVAVIHTLNRLNSDSELIVLTASGAPTWTLARPLLLLALLVSLAVAFVNHIGQPWSLRMLRESIIQVRTDLLSQVIQPGRFSSAEPGVTIHIRDRRLDGELSDILMHDERKPGEVMSYLAERGVIVRQGESSYLYLSTGHILRRTSPTEPPQVIAFDTYAIDLERFERKDAAPDLKPRERYLSELLDPGPLVEDGKRGLGQLRAELHERFSNPLYPFVFVLVALAFVGQAKSTRQSPAEQVVYGFLVAASVRLAGLAVNNLIVLRPQAAPLIYLLPLSAMALAAFGIWRNAWPRRSGPSLVERAGPILAVLERLRPRGRTRLSEAR